MGLAMWSSLVTLTRTVLEEGGNESVFGEGSEEEWPGSSREPPLAAPRGSLLGNPGQASITQKQVRSLGAISQDCRQRGEPGDPARPQSYFP